jgi:hypothetical protein
VLRSGEAREGVDGALFAVPISEFKGEQYRSQEDREYHPPVSMFRMRGVALRHREGRDEDCSGPLGGQLDRRQHLGVLGVEHFAQRGEGHLELGEVGLARRQRLQRQPGGH